MVLIISVLYLTLQTLQTLQVPISLQNHCFFLKIVDIFSKNIDIFLNLLTSQLLYTNIMTLWQKFYCGTIFENEE